jgi:hypothetical protein
VRVTPPLGWSTWPITALPPGPARNATAPVTSSGVGEAVHRDLLAIPLAHRLQCDPGGAGRRGQMNYGRISENSDQLTILSGTAV